MNESHVIKINNIVREGNKSQLKAQPTDATAIC
jgi:hypothetical protein